MKYCYEVQKSTCAKVGKAIPPFDYAKGTPNKFISIKTLLSACSSAL